MLVLPKNRNFLLEIVINISQMIKI